jgi:hypothetical protein
MTAIIRSGPPWSRPSSAGGIEPDDEADVRDVVGDEGEQAPQDRKGNVQHPQHHRVDDGDDQPEYRRNEQVTARALGERPQCTDDLRALAGGRAQPSRVLHRVEAHEQQDGDQEDPIGQQAECPAEHRLGHVRDATRLDLPGEVL